MNEYAKEGKKFLTTLDCYFQDFEKAVGYSILQYLRNDNLNPTDTPNPIKIIDSFDMLCHNGDGDLTLYIHRRRGFDGYCTFLDSEGKISDPHIRVYVSDKGIWQLTLLLVLSMHVMPMYWHACYMRWTPIFCKDDLQKLRKSKRQFSSSSEDTHEFLPKDLPVEPSVIPLEEGRIYQTVFYVWSEFAGYLKIVSTITFPEKTAFAIVRDVDIKTKTEKIVSYRAPVVL